VHVAKAQQAERGQHQYADACAEVTAVDSDEELKHDSAHAPSV
jgi:hypothetical protein